MQLAMNYPSVHPTFIDSSGENQPTIRQGHHVLLQEYFGGSASENKKQNALDVVETRKYPDTSGIVTVGVGAGTPSTGPMPSGVPGYEEGAHPCAVPGGAGGPHLDGLEVRRGAKHGLVDDQAGRYRLSRRADSCPERGRLSRWWDNLAGCPNRDWASCLRECRGEPQCLGCHMPADAGVRRPG